MRALSCFDSGADCVFVCQSCACFVGRIEGVEGVRTGSTPLNADFTHFHDSTGDIARLLLKIHFILSKAAVGIGAVDVDILIVSQKIF